MGWLVSMDPTKDRKALVEEILGDFRRNQYPYPTLLDHSLQGNTLYMVLHNPTRRVSGVEALRVGVSAEDLPRLEYRLVGNYRFIAVYLLAGSRNRDEGWGYKSMDESMGPAVVDCPERLLKQSQVEDRYGWRDECRRVRKEKNLRAAWAKGLKPGEQMLLFRGYYFDKDTCRQETRYEAVIYDRPYSRTFFVGHFKGDTKQYRMRWSDVKTPEEDAA